MRFTHFRGIARDQLLPRVHSPTTVARKRSSAARRLIKGQRNQQGPYRRGGLTASTESCTHDVLSQLSITTRVWLRGGGMDGVEEGERRSWVTRPIRPTAKGATGTASYR